MAVLFYGVYAMILYFLSTTFVLYPALRSSGRCCCSIILHNENKDLNIVCRLVFYTLFVRVIVFLDGFCRSSVSSHVYASENEHKTQTT